MPDVGKITKKELEEMVSCIKGVKYSDFSIAKERYIKLITDATDEFNRDSYDSFIIHIESILDNFKDYIYKKCWPSKNVPTLYLALNDKKFKSLLSKNNIDTKVIPLLDDVRTEGNTVKHDSTKEIDMQKVQIIALTLPGWIKGFCNVFDDIYTPKLKIVEVLNSRNKYNLEIDITSNHPVKVIQYEISITGKNNENVYHLVNLENKVINFNEQDDNKYISVRALFEGFDDYIYSKVYGPIVWKKLKSPIQVQPQINEMQISKGEKTEKNLSASIVETLPKEDDTLKLNEEIVNRLFSIQERVCNKYILMKYGLQGIKSEYISEISPKENLIGLKTSYRYIEDLLLEYSKLLMDNTGDDDIRILYTGEVGCGSTAQLLNLCKQSIANRNRFVIYVLPTSLNHQSLLEYIFNTYLKEVTKFKNMDPEEAFFELKKSFEKQKKITIVFDEYNKNEKQVKDELDKIIKFESGLIDGVDIIVKTRYKDGSWPQSFLEVVSIGIPDNRIKDILNDNGIVIDLLQISSSCLKSPWLLKLLVEEVSNEFRNVSNPGRLIRKSIDKRVETSARDGINMEILRFSVYALLPHISNLSCFDKVELYNTLPQLVREVAEMGIVPESFVALDYLDTLDKSKTRVYNEFYGNPIVQTMGLMHEEKKENASKISLEWEDSTVGSVFCAIEIVNFFSNALCEEAFKLLNAIVKPLLEMENITFREEIDTSNFYYFDSARYVIDLLDEELLSEMTDLYPEPFAYLYCGLAVVYELSGNEFEKYKVSVKAMTLLNKLLKEGMNTIPVAHWLSKMSYYVIKCKDIKTDEFSASLMQAKECLKNSVDFYENRMNSLSNREHFELSKMYGNMGAYFLKIKDYNNSFDWHKKSLEVKKLCLKSSLNGLDKKEIEEGIRRSFASIGTDLYHLKNYEESLDYHDKAIEIGIRIHSRNRYESYSRKVGSYIGMYDRDKDWSIKKAELLFDYLEEDIKIMGKYINKEELKDIYKHGDEILSSLSQFVSFQENNQISQIKSKAIKIEELYNNTMWDNKNKIFNYFKEG